MRCLPGPSPQNGRGPRLLVNEGGHASLNNRFFLPSFQHARRWCWPERRRRMSQRQATRRPRRTNVSIQMMSGLIGGTVSTLLCAPLDLARTRMQIRTRKNGGLGSVLLGTFKAEGVSGLYRGVSTGLLTVPTHFAIFFPMYEIIKRKHYLGDREFSNYVLASMGAGAVAEVFTNPLWVIRTRIQTHYVHFGHASSAAVTARTGFLETAREIARSEGLPAFYKGFGATMLALCHIGILMPTYETLKQDSFCGNSLLGILCASSISKVTALTVAYPLEVVRTRLQDQRAVGSERKYSGIINTFRIMLKEEGCASLYAGITANLSRVVPSTAATLLAYECTVSFFYQDE